MRDKELVMEVLHQIEEAAAKIVDRFKAIHQVADFTDNFIGTVNYYVPSFRLTNSLCPFILI